VALNDCCELMTLEDHVSDVQYLQQCSEPCVMMDFHRCRHIVHYYTETATLLGGGEGCGGGADSYLMADTSSITSYCERLAGPEVQLKPPAMKNELNAAIHFIKFVKKIKNLAMTDPTFFATLRKINKDQKRPHTVYTEMAKLSMRRVQRTQWTSCSRSHTQRHKVLVCRDR